MSFQRIDSNQDVFNFGMFFNIELIWSNLIITQLVKTLPKDRRFKFPPLRVIELMMFEPIILNYG